MLTPEANDANKAVLPGGDEEVEQEDFGLDSKNLEENIEERKDRKEESHKEKKRIKKGVDKLEDNEIFTVGESPPETAILEKQDKLLDLITKNLDKAKSLKQRIQNKKEIDLEEKEDLENAFCLVCDRLQDIYELFKFQHDQIKGKINELEIARQACHTLNQTIIKLEHRIVELENKLKEESKNEHDKSISGSSESKGLSGNVEGVMEGYIDHDVAINMDPEFRKLFDQQVEDLKKQQVEDLKKQQKEQNRRLRDSVRQMARKLIKQFSEIQLGKNQPSEE